MIHTREIVTATASDHSFQLDIDGETVGVVARTSSKEIRDPTSRSRRRGQ